MLKQDILVPRDNEELLLASVKKLGFKEVILLYESSLPRYKSKFYGPLKVFTAGLVKNIFDVQKYKKNHDFIFAPAERQFFENKHITHIMNAELDERGDSLHQRRSGLDEVMCSLAKKNEKTIVFNVSLLSDQGILGRMKQNAGLCRKHKLKVFAASFASKPMLLRSAKDIDAMMHLL